MRFHHRSSTVCNAGFLSASRRYESRTLTNFYADRPSIANDGIALRYFRVLVNKCERPRLVAILQTYIREYRTPKRRSIANLNRSLVHRSASKPLNFGECRRAAAIHDSASEPSTGGVTLGACSRRTVSRSARPRSSVSCLTYTREKLTPNRCSITVLRRPSVH